MKFISRSSSGRLGVLAATAAVSMSFTGVASAAVATGPSDDTFYSPAASKYSSGKPGDVIWKRAAQPATTLSNAAQSITVVYKSKSAANKLVPVSGTVWIPKGTAPSGGWPVISWGHGTTGSADICAPSRIADVTSGSYTSYVFPSINTWLGKGYAVAMSDYEGLGTPGVHPWLIGPSEGHGVIDIVKAARKLNSSVSTKWIAAGHSQGGHAVMFAASLAKSYGTGLTFKGVIAYAPASNMKETVKTAAVLIKTANGISGLGALLIRSISIADPTKKLNVLMPSGPYALLGQIEQRCLGGDLPNPSGTTPIERAGGLGASDSFGQYAPRDLLIGPFTGGNWTAPGMQAALNVLDGSMINSNVKITGVPIKLLQGAADGTVPASSTQTLFAQQKVKNGSANVTYTEYPGVDHGGVVAAGLTDANAFLRARFGR